MMNKDGVIIKGENVKLYVSSGYVTVNDQNLLDLITKSLGVKDYNSSQHFNGSITVIIQRNEGVLKINGEEFKEEEVESNG